MTESDTCLPGTEEVIYKIWQGTQTMCLCHRDYMDEHRLGACSSSKSRLNLDFDGSYCAELAALSPVIQAKFGGYRVCGTRGGLPYIDQLRVQSSGSCPDGTSPCSLTTSLSNTICYASD